MNRLFGKGSNQNPEKHGVNSANLQQLAKSGEVQQLMSLLQQNGGVQNAAKSASGGNPAELLGMVQQLMNTEEGANLIGNIQKKAKEAGIE